MKRLSRNAPCPCGSGRNAKGCCARILDGEAAQTPEALMRSRYTAYAVGDVAHLMNTTHPDSPHWRVDRRLWATELREFSTTTDFVALDVQYSSVTGDEAVVQFHATLRQHDADASFTERSRFLRVDGRWLYVNAT